MIKTITLYLLTLLLLIRVEFVYSFSEIEIDSLESSGKKIFSQNPWRTELSLSLQRNLEVNTRFMDLLDTKKDSALLDLSNLYYGISLSLNYSLTNWSHASSQLKNTELFIASSFNSPFKGHKSNLKDYSFTDYFSYALGDLITGFTTPLYKKGNLLSYFDFAFVALPLSRFSKEAGLSTSTGGTLSLLYFLKKEKKWSLSLSSSHNFSYSFYKKVAADVKGAYYNVPFDTSQSANLIYRQSWNKFMPLSLQTGFSYYLGINTQSTQNHYLTFSASSSWKLRKRAFLFTSLRWKDSIYRWNPINENVKKKEPIRFNLSKLFFALGLSHSF